MLPTFQLAADVSIPAHALVDRSLLQKVSGGYLVHDVVLKYLRMRMKNDEELRHQAISRQKRYLTNRKVLKGLSVGKEDPSGGILALVSLWSSLWELELYVDVTGGYRESLWDAGDVDAWHEAGHLLQLLVRGLKSFLTKSKLFFPRFYMLWSSLNPFMVWSTLCRATSAEHLKCSEGSLKWPGDKAVNRKSSCAP